MIMALISLLLLIVSGYAIYQLNQPPIIGGADGPTGILVASTWDSYIPLFAATGILCRYAGVLMEVSETAAEISDAF